MLKNSPWELNAIWTKFSDTIFGNMHPCKYLIFGHSGHFLAPFSFIISVQYNYDHWWQKNKFLKGSTFCCFFSLYLTLMILIFSTYFVIFPLDYRLTGVKLALIVFYKFCIELNIIHGLWIVPRKVQIKLWSTLASLWNSNLKISIPASESFSSFWKWKLGSTSVS